MQGGAKRVVSNVVNGIWKTRKLPSMVRAYCSESKADGPFLLEGKTQGVITAWWQQYKWYVVGVGSVLGVVGALGVTASAIAVGGLGIITGGAYLWTVRRAKTQQRTLRDLFEPLLDLHRPQIEKLIGSFEIPTGAAVASDSATVPTPSGGTEFVLRNVFYLDGKHGKAFVRALAVKDEKSDSYSLRKLIVDASDYRNTDHQSISIVDITPEFVFVDAPSFTSHALSDYIQIKQAALDASRKATRDQRRKAANKSSASDRLDRVQDDKSSSQSSTDRLSSNKPPKSKKEIDL